MTLFSSGMGLVVQIVSTVVLARLITPRDFGLVTMVTTLSLLLVNFGYNGLTEAIVQKEELTRPQASTLFWVNAGSGLLLTVAFSAAGSLIAGFYHEPVLRTITVGISLSIVVTGISVVPLALLKRGMRFSEVSVNDIVARLIAVTVSIALAFMGWGYWALVAGIVVLPVSTATGAFLLCRWLPGLPRQAADVRHTLRFALHAYGSFCVNYFSRNTDNLLVGWRFKAQALGFYKKAFDLFALSTTQLMSSLTVVVLATLSRVRPGSDQYRRYLFGALTVVAFMGMGMAACLTVEGRDLIRVLLGTKWSESGNIFTYFAPGIGIMTIYATHTWIHLSIGRADRWFRWTIVEFIVTFLLFLIALHWGPRGIAVAWTVSIWLLTIPAFWYAGRPIGLRVGSIVAALWRYIAASLITVVATMALLRLAPSFAYMPGTHGAMCRLAIISSWISLLYLGTLVLLHGGLAPLSQMFALALEMLPRSRAMASEDSSLIAQISEEHTVETVDQQMPGKQNYMPLVSILIPAYNAQKWIADTIQSALAQTWPHVEIIVVDDGSKDQTLEIARQFEANGVRVISQKNQGAAASRNNAFAQSTGDYIQWLDADDLLAPDKIALQLEVVKQGAGPEILLSSEWGSFMYRPYRAQFTPTALWHDLSRVEWLLRKMEQNIFMQTSTWLVSRKLTEAAGLWDTRLLGDDDGEYFCRVLLESEGVRFVPGSKVFYRTFKFDSLSHVGRSTAKIEAHWLAMQLHIQYLRSLEESPRVKAACLQFLRDSLMYFYPEQHRILEMAEQIAAESGFELGAPTLSWKYVWIEKLFGWDRVKPVQQLVRKLRWRLEGYFDKALFVLEGRHAR
ncbi:oligosaccharide flippase family protein [Acidobacterium sp. S8]|uniref:oligosaccharide flippase family protein n=1 Tax=Acidobacterium sp. S8 TaxID=1641854 RepID=UPI00131C8707|nr:oligosaccharide flippase family protein [Acidobacterium sp. S8]